MNTNIKIGWSEVDITPAKNISLRGQFYERISEYVESPLNVTALAIEADGDQMVMCSCDLTSITPELTAKVRKLVAAESSEIDVNKIILHATHTHTSYLYNAPAEDKLSGVKVTSGLSVLTSLVPDDMLYKPKVTVDDSIENPEDSFRTIANGAAKAVLEAWAARKDSIYACGFGRAAVGMNRRVCFDDGSAQMWGDTNTPNFTHLEGGNDNGVEMLFTFDTDKKLTGVILNVACPSQVCEHRNYVSSDYWGKVKQKLREKFGDELYILGLCAAGGDQCPRDLVRWQNGETPVFDPNISRPHYIERRSDGSMFDIQGTVRIGRRIANEVFAAYDEVIENGEYFSDVKFEHRAEMMPLPLRRVTLSDYNNAKAAIEKFIEKNRGRSFDYNDTAAMHVHAGIMARFEDQQNCDIVPTEVHCIRLGDVAFATNPFELFLDYGNQIRARSLAKQTFIAQLSCDCLSYLPTEKAEQGSHYSAYVSSGKVGHIGGEQLVRQTLTEINDMFAEA